MAGARCALEKTLKRIKMARMTALSCGRARLVERVWVLRSSESVKG
jgi:hypothetical protein